MPYAPGFTPIEMRVGQDDGHAANYQPQKAKRENPVSDANERGMAGRGKSVRGLD
jgi:hypothetical protein